MVREIPDKAFQRDGDDLVVHVRIRLEDALSEGKIDVPHLDGRILRVPLKEARALPSMHHPSANSMWLPQYHAQQPLLVCCPAVG